MSDRKDKRRATSALAELIDAAIPLHAVNVTVTEPGSRLVYNAEDVLGVPNEPTTPIAARVFPLIRAWVEAAAELRDFHETRLDLGGPERRARVVFEWRLPTRGELESVNAGIFAQATPEVLAAEAPGYPLDGAQRLQRATQVLMLELAREATPVRVEVRTHLLG